MVVGMPGSGAKSLTACWTRGNMEMQMEMQGNPGPLR